MPAKIDIPIDEMLELHAAGASESELAARYGCCRAVIGSRVRELGRSHLVGARRRYTADDGFFSQVETESQAYWLGFLLADGGVMQTGRGNWYVQLALAARDLGHIRKFKQAIGSTYPIKKRSDKEAYATAVYSRQMAHDLVELQCYPRKTGVHGTPQVAPALIRHMYRGYFDGDGCLAARKDNAWCWHVVGSVPFVSEFQQWLMMELGLSQTRTYMRGPVINVRYSGRRQVTRICDLLYDGATVYLDRKFKKYQQLIEAGKSLRVPAP